MALIVTLECEWCPVDLSMFQGGPFDESVTAPGVQWPGTYTSEVRAKKDETTPLLATMSVSATVVATDTVFTINMTREESEKLPAGTYFWDARDDAGTVRLSGKVVIKAVTTP